MSKSEIKSAAKSIVNRQSVTLFDLLQLCSYRPELVDDLLECLCDDFNKFLYIQQDDPDNGIWDGSLLFDADSRQFKFVGMSDAHGHGVKKELVVDYNAEFEVF